MLIQELPIRKKGVAKDQQWWKHGDAKSDMRADNGCRRGGNKVTKSRQIFTISITKANFYDIKIIPKTTTDQQLHRKAERRHSSPKRNK